MIGLGLAEALARAAPDVPKEKYAELGARYRHHYLQHQDDLVLFDGVLPMLDALHARGHKLAVATGKSRAGPGRGARHASRCATASTARAPPTRPPASRIRACCCELMDEFGRAGRAHA